MFLQRTQRYEVDSQSAWRPSSTKPRSRPSPRRFSTLTQRMPSCLKPSPSSFTMTGWSPPSQHQLSTILLDFIRKDHWSSSCVLCCQHDWIEEFKALSCALFLSEPTLLVRACNQLGQFLQHRETNLRYLALESMCTLASSEFSHEAVKTHMETVINALKVSLLTVM